MLFVFGTQLKPMINNPGKTSFGEKDLIFQWGQKERWGRRERERKGRDRGREGREGRREEGERENIQVEFSFSPALISSTMA